VVQRGTGCAVCYSALVVERDPLCPNRLITARKHTHTNQYFDNCRLFYNTCGISNPFCRQQDWSDFLENIETR
jgi:hypothetical protein